jgi:hypothetical protein
MTGKYSVASLTIPLTNTEKKRVKAAIKDSLKSQLYDGDLSVAEYKAKYREIIINTIGKC